MLIKWSEHADDDLAEILASFLNLDEEERGKRIVSLIIKSTTGLVRYPLSGKPGRMQGTRELILQKLPYILVYRALSPEILEVARVLHTSKLWPESLSEDLGLE